MKRILIVLALASLLLIGCTYTTTDDFTSEVSDITFSGGMALFGMYYTVHFTDGHAVTPEPINSSNEVLVEIGKTYHVTVKKDYNSTHVDFVEME